MHAPRPLRTVAARALAYETYSLAITPSLIAGLFGDRVTDEILREGGYCHVDDPDDPDSAIGWWIPSGRSVPDPDRFFLPIAFHDPFGNPPTTVMYDDHLLVVTSVSDARQNTTRAVTDYRVMAPWQVTDINRNESSVEFDVLG